MLAYIEIDNMAVIKHAEIEFSDGLNVLTGETGSGKSVIIGAISMSLGKRISKDIVRTGEEKASVSAMYYPTDRAWEQICAVGIENDCDGELLIFREISSQGRGICKINGKIVTSAQLKDVGNLLINIHGQQDTAVLYSPDRHLSLLDSWTGDKLKQKLDIYEEIFEKYKSQKAQLKKLDELKDDREREMDILKYQIDEISALSLQGGEYDAAVKRIEVLKSGEKITKALKNAYELFVSNQNSAANMLHSAARHLKAVSDIDEKLGSLYEKVLDTAYRADDAASDIINIQREAQYSENELDDLESRVYEIKKLCQKYKCDANGLETFALEACDKYKQLENIDIEYGNLKGEFSKTEQSLTDISNEIHEIRLKNALILEKELETQLAQLNMKGCEFKIKLEKTQNFTPIGNSQAEFYISPNAGEELKPLAKIASGGELSRVMLAIKSIISSYDVVGTYIFDEIDTGISGKTAEKVAENLVKVAKNNQTIIITHSPHIAAIADTHFLIYKTMTETETKTQLQALDEDGKIEEIARISSGSHISNAARIHAKELRATAQKAKDSM